MEDLERKIKNSKIRRRSKEVDIKTISQVDQDIWKKS